MAVGVKLLSEHASVPEYGTALSACADIRACLLHVDRVKAYGVMNGEHLLHVVDGKIDILPGYRVLVPTGLALDIPEGYSVRTHPRSGKATKEGLGLACSEGVIDEDYQKELFVPVVNNTIARIVISHGDRIAQAELVKDERCQWVVVEELTPKDSSREGGFGHTGTT